MIRGDGLRERGGNKVEKIVVRGGRTLHGTVKVQGAKNAVLPILAAALLAQEGTSTIQDVPQLDDVHTMCDVLRALGAQTRFSPSGLVVDARDISCSEAPYELVRKMRASFLVMGPLLARLGEARVSLPGGCAIGTRPIDQHLKGFEALGAQVTLENGSVYAVAPHGLTGTTIYLDVASVGATENIMMAAVLAKGTTIIENAAQEPEIVDLANFLNAMGAKVRGAGTGTIRIDGVPGLRGTTHTVIPDRIEAGTFMVAAAMTGGDVFVDGAIAEHLKPVIAKLKEMGVLCLKEEQGIRVQAPERLRNVSLKTLPYPGFPTDMQPQMMALMLVAEGTGIVTETVFENRFMHVQEFIRMNGDIKIEGRTAIIEGPCRLRGAHVTGSDLRATAALVLAGLAAEGTTHVYGLHHLDRGYLDFVGKLKALGADIERVVEEEPEPPRNLVPFPADRLDDVSRRSSVAGLR